MLLAILGSHPALSLAELASVYGPGQVKRLSDELALIDSSDVRTLGGVIKLAKVLDESSHTQVSDIELARHVPKGKKLSIGLSVYGAKMSARRINQIGIGLKQQLKAGDTPARIVPNKQAALSSAQVLHNQLAGKGIELIIAIHQSGAIVAQTVYSQDIDSYSRRDYGRPCRDPKVGMLPPKLAQIMINLAAPQPGSTILDPFCGTGVVLQESLLMGYKAAGSDISERMVACSSKNLDWLSQQYEVKPSWRLTAADAQTARFAEPIDAVVAETDLGPPLSREPDQLKLRRILDDSNRLVKSTLSNLAQQIEAGTPVCIAVPFWQVGDRAVDLPLVDQMRTLGYNHKSFIGAGALRYRRPNQLVGRRLLALERSTTDVPH